MKVTTVLLYAIILVTLLLTTAPSILAKDKTQTNTIDGCVCEVNKAATMLKVVPWNEQKKTWGQGAAQSFRFDDKTKITAENKLTVADVNAGRAIKTYHFTGIQQGKLTGTPFEIKELSGLVGRRTTLHWEDKATTRRAVEIVLPYLFAGESMPAMVGSDSAQAVGSDNCPCGSR
jgi:hypothetical protein